MDNIAVKIEHISKQYRLGIINSGTFFRDMQSYIAKCLGKPNPHAKIGDEDKDVSDSFWALKDINLDIHQGERIGIIGKNGAGKSTLLKLISQISSPSEGEIKIRGKVTSLLEVGTGFNGELTGRENIYLNGAILGMKRRQIDKRIDEIIDFSGIERHIDTPAKRYSSGMYVRLAFAVAAHLDSDILIADEVLAVGDAAFQKKAIGKMNDLNSSQGRTVVFVSHQMNFISQLCNTCAILEKGRLTYYGKTNEGIRQYLETGSSVCEIKYDNNESRTIMITGFKLQNESGEPRSQFTSVEPIRAEIEYVVNEPVRAAYIAFHIWGPEEQNLIDSCDVDSEHDNYEKRAPGKYVTSVVLPAPLLNAGHFYAEAWAGIPSANTEFFRTEKMPFDVIDLGSDLSRFNKTRDCLLSPSILWNTSRYKERTDEI